MTVTSFSYSGNLSQQELLHNAVANGPKSIDYTKLVNYLANEICVLGNFDENVNVISSPEDAVAFIMEVTSLLKELSKKIRFIDNISLNNSFQVVRTNV